MTREVVPTRVGVSAAWPRREGGAVFGALIDDIREGNFFRRPSEIPMESVNRRPFETGAAHAPVGWNY
jgi:hypothetical protein